ncbi:MAG: DUF4923 family protein [Muribaculaceae bacterium]|nr:DUF4923 family protein [Muribaculaceae bacterium]
MKKLFFSFVALLAFAFSASAQFNLKDAVNALSGSSSGKSTAGDVVSTIGGLLGGNKVDIKSLTGTWVYSAPAVTFESDNLLKKAGGAAASSVIVNKIKPYYQKFGVPGTTVEIKADSTMTITKGKMKVSGTLEPQSEAGKFLLNIKALGKVPAGKITVYISGNSNKIQITAAADKLLSLVSKIGKLSGNSTLKTVSSIADSYEGLNLGMEMTKSK